MSMPYRRPRYYVALQGIAVAVLAWATGAVLRPDALAGRQEKCKDDCIAEFGECYEGTGKWEGTYCYYSKCVGTQCYYTCGSSSPCPPE